MMSNKKTNGEIMNNTENVNDKRKDENQAEEERLPKVICLEPSADCPYYQPTAKICAVCKYGVILQ